MNTYQEKLATEIKNAIDMATVLVNSRKDCDMTPVIKEFTVIFNKAGTEYQHILVDICYSSDGFRALYEYRIADNSICLAQD